MGIKTNNLYHNIMSEFVSSLTNISHYIFGSSLNDDQVTNNSERGSKLFLEKTIFGKKIEQSEVRYLINKNFWTSKIYDQYDDTKDLTLLDFYVISEPDSFSGAYYVFKCLSNNYGAISTTKPTYNVDLNLHNYILMTPDGYVWKYMYDVSNARYKTHSTNLYFPVFRDADVSDDAKESIDLIIVENPTLNSGYEKAIGTIYSLGGNPGGYKRIILSTNDYQTSNDFYLGYTLYTTSPNGVDSKIYEVKNSGVSGDRLYVDVEGYVAEDISNPQANIWTFSLLPAVDIIGDGTAAIAIPNIVNTSIQSITILDRGQGYTRAIARIRKPLRGFNTESENSGDISCILRAIVSPAGIDGLSGGHGKVPALELCSKAIIISSEIDSSVDISIPSTNTYSKIGLVKTPVFSSAEPLAFDNRIIVQLDSVNLLNAGDVVTQTDTNFRGIIHAISVINNLIYITEYFGPYTDQTESDNFYLSNIVTLSLSYQLSTPIGRVDIIDIDYPSYVQMSGEVLYVSDFEPIIRSEVLSEQFKFILEF